MMHITECNTTTENAPMADRFSEMFGPIQIDQSIRAALQLCWMALPTERRNADELEKQIRRLVDRALKDFRDDQAAFGKPS